METTVYVLMVSFLLGGGEVSSTEVSQRAFTLEGCIAASDKFYSGASRHKPDDIVGFTVECVPINFRVPAEGEKDAEAHQINQSRRV